MRDRLKNISRGYRRLVWEADIQSMSGARRFLIVLLRLVRNLVLSLTEGPMTLRAASLVYTTLLSLVPLLAVGFSVLKALGVHNQIEPILYHVLRPLGAQGSELAQYIIQFVNNMRVRVLGSLGLAILIYTVVSLLQKIEEAFNLIWHIPQTRRLTRRFSDYLSVILVGPVLVFSALGITAALMNSDVIHALSALQPFAAIIHVITRLLPYVLVCIAFTFVYIFIPNTRVRFSSALVGGLVGGILWESGGLAFAAFVATSTRYTLIYSSFAIVIMFMIWLYVSWLIVLAGAQVAYYHQHPAMIDIRRSQLRLGHRGRERAAVSAMLLIGYNYYHQQLWWSCASLANRINIPSQALSPILESLKRNNLISESGDDPPLYFPARDIEKIELLSILNAVRRTDAPPWINEPELDKADEVMKRVDDALGAALAQETLKGLVNALPPPQDQPV